VNVRGDERLHLIAAQSRGARVLGTVAAICTVFPAIALAFLVALNTFWWCVEGGCSLAPWGAKLRLFVNVSGLAVLLVFFSLFLQFPFLLLARPFCSKGTVEECFLKYSLPWLEWHDALIRKWINVLWRTH